MKLLVVFLISVAIAFCARSGRYYRIQVDKLSALPPQDQTFFVVNRLDGAVEAYAEDASINRILKSGLAVTNITDPHAKRSIEQNSWPNNNDIATRLQNIADQYPHLTKLFSIGKSVRGEDIWVLEISNNPGDRTENKPDFKYIGNMHGDETVGRELIMSFITYSLENYQQRAEITRLIDETHMFLCPTMNPDGFTLGPRRSNANGYDLNRNFPDQFRDPNNTPAGRQAETRAIMEWMQSGEYKFKLSANFHGGALCVNYPYDCNAQGQSGRYTPTPDDDLFIHISLTYSRLNVPMFTNPAFKDGITNGAQWYCIYGSMQDWNYVWEDCFETTLEVSNSKMPSYSTYPTYWEHNRESMIMYAMEIFTAVQGTVHVSGTKTVPEGATVRLVGSDHESKVHKGGMFYRLVRPGKHTLVASAPGCETQTVEVFVEREHALAKHQFELKC